MASSWYRGGVKAEEIKRIRTGLGLSQVEFARDLGVAFTTVNRWENGKAVPQNDRVARLRDLAAAGETQKAAGSEMREAVPVPLNFEGGCAGC